MRLIRVGLVSQILGPKQAFNQANQQYPLLSWTAVTLMRRNLIQLKTSTI